MKIFLNQITFLLLFILHFPMFASNKDDIYKAYIKSDMVSWKNVIDQMQQQNSKTTAFLLELVNYQYGYIGYCVTEEKFSEAALYLKKAEQNLALLEIKPELESVVQAYKSAFAGYKVSMSPAKAPILGPKSVAFAEKAMQLDKNSALGYLQYGNTQYYMPAIFGGSKTVAIDYYKKAQVLMESDLSKVKNDWNYLNLLLTMARAYTELKYYRTAQQYYDKILKAEPEFLVVKNELYPKLLKIINK